MKEKIKGNKIRQIKQRDTSGERIGKGKEVKWQGHMQLGTDWAGSAGERPGVEYAQVYFAGTHLL